MLLVKRFNKVCEKYPYTSQGLVSGVLSIAGDFIAQKCIEKKEKFDFKRSFNFMVIGYFTGIALRKWYGILELKITNPKPFVQAASKVLVDQTIFAPTYLGSSIALLGYVQTGSVEETKKIFHRDFCDIMIANYKFWPATQFATFFFVPFHFRVGFNSLMALMWSAYFSFKTYSSNDETLGRKSDE